MHVNNYKCTPHNTEMIKTICFGCECICDNDVNIDIVQSVVTLFVQTFCCHSLADD